MSIIASDTIVKNLKDVCEKHHVTRLRIFGSTVAGNARPDRDVDLLVDYDAAFAPKFILYDGATRE
jgi:uncharacterized protein